MGAIKTPAARQVPVDVPVPAWRVWCGAPAALLLCGVAAFVVAGSTPWAGHVVLAGLALVVSGLFAGCNGVRMHRRADLMVSLQDRLLRVCGPSTLKATRWSGTRWPRKLRITYSRGAPVQEPGWKAAVCTSVEEVFDHSYAVRRHRGRHRELVLRAVPPVAVDAAPERDYLRQRAEALVGQLLPGCTVTAAKTADSGVLTSMTVKHQLGTKLAAGGYPRRVEGAFNRLMDGRWRVKWDMINDSARFELRPTFPDLVRLPVPQPDSRPPRETYKELRILVGVDEDGNVTAWRPVIDPHMMLVGATGTGKTVTVREVIVNVANAGWAIWILDGKGIEFLGLRDFPNVQIVANRVPDQIALLYRAHQMMEKRYQQMDLEGADEDDFEPALIVIDEWADFRSAAVTWYSTHKPKGAPRLPDVLDMLGSLLRKGRTARVHVLLGTQRPDQEYFGGDMRDNVRMRVSMGRLSPQGALMMWESASVGVALPRGKRGRATSVNAAGQPVEIQTFFVPDPRKTAPGSEDDGWLQQYRPQQVRHDRLVIVPPEHEADLDSDDGDLIEPDYYQFRDAVWARASDRPDLDPIVRAASSKRAAPASTPTALLGLEDHLVDDVDQGEQESAPVNLGKEPHEGALVDDPETCAPQPPRLRLVGAGESSSPAAGFVDDNDTDPGDVAGLDGYGESDTFSPDELQPGWLWLEDEASNWVTVEEIGEDLLDPSQTSISWRDDDDGAGSTSVSADGVVIARAPLER